MGVYDSSVTLQTLINLSEGRTISATERALAFKRAPLAIRRFAIGWVLVDRARTPERLAAFAREAFGLRLIESAEGYDLYAVTKSPAALLPD